MAQTIENRNYYPQEFLGKVDMYLYLVSYYFCFTGGLSYSESENDYYKYNNNKWLLLLEYLPCARYYNRLFLDVISLTSSNSTAEFITVVLSLLL